RSDLESDGAEREYPLLLLVDGLAQIEVDGSDCFALVVHRTRRYSGFFRRRVSRIIEELVNSGDEAFTFDDLPVLNEIIDFIRGRPHYDALRHRVLAQISRITRGCRELKVFNEASQTRELRVFRVRKLT
ncbi:MAG: hypothetical protein JXR89_05310, partial [Deltaproteobacteria bacterium]|nr:hypothetical protein [Deltaproteobacteria bacterium]